MREYASMMHRGGLGTASWDDPEDSKHAVRSAGVAKDHRG